MANRNRSHVLLEADELGLHWEIDVPSISLMVDNRDDLNELKDLGNAEGLAKSFHSDLVKGINDDDDRHQSRVQQYGTNVVPEPPATTLFELMLEQLQDPVLIILICAACVSLPVGAFENPSTGWIEGTAILVSVCIVVVVASVNDYQKELQFRALNKKKNDIDIKVVRDGKQANISINDLLVGDVVMLETGDQVPCDGVLFKSSGLKANESALTGEVKEANKNVEENPFVIGGTQIVDGLGSMIVVAVGMNSMSGRINKMINTSDGEEETALQIKLTHIAELIGKFGFAIAAFTVLVLIVGYIIAEKVIDENDFAYADVSKILKFLIVGLTIVVVAVPEGLPLAVTISMAFSVQKMLQDKNLVRHLDACEVMGGATTICSDKTGTLTRNKMTAVKILLGDGLKAERTVGESLASAMESATAALRSVLIDIMVYNSTARISFDNLDQPGIRQDTGNKTECALLELARDLGVEKSSLVPDDFEYEMMHTFSSARKRMSCVVKKDSKYRILVKGASEVVLKLCTHTIRTNGTVAPISDKDKDNIKQTIDEFAGEALRTLVLAYRDCSAGDFSDAAHVEKDLVFVCLVGIEDPLRPEVPGAVRKCHEAGIVVRMVTGDNLNTAQAIAKQCGILRKGDVDAVLEGPEFRRQVLSDQTDTENINMEVFREIVPRLRVLARSSPADKYVLVKGLKEMDEVVAVTGDGTNDGPALRQANVGLSMGIQGTEVAKEASDIILMDDNFNSIVSAVKWGRNVFDSISKFVQFQLTVNIVAIIVAVVGAFTIQESPLTAVQMLWVNLIMDTLASLALATEAPTEELLTRPPYDPKRPIISHYMWHNIIGQSIYQLAILLFLIFEGHNAFDLGINGAHQELPTKHFTVVFNTFVMLQVFNEINARKIHREINVFEGFFSNYYFVSIIIGTILVQYLIIEFGGLPLSTVSLGLNEWLICLAFGAGSLIVGLIIHTIPLNLLPKQSEPVQNVERKASLGPLYRGGRRRTKSIKSFKQNSRPSTLKGDEAQELARVVASHDY